MLCPLKLEIQLQRKLKLPRIVGLTAYDAEVRIWSVPVIICSRATGRVWLPELDPIEGVEHLGAKLQVYPLTDRSPLDSGNIPVRSILPANAGIDSRLIPKRVIACLGKATRVEPLGKPRIGRPRRIFRLAIRDHVTTGHFAAVQHQEQVQAD